MTSQEDNVVVVVTSGKDNTHPPVFNVTKPIGGGNGNSHGFNQKLGSRSSGSYPNTYNSDKKQQSKDNGGFWRCIAVVVILILLGGLGVGIYFAVTASDGENTGDTMTTTSPTMTTLSPDKVRVAHVSGEIVIHNSYSADLTDSSSALYQEYATQLCGEINRVAGASAGPFYHGCTVKGFRPGSIIALYLASFMPESQTQESQLGNLNNWLIEAIENNDFMDGMVVTIETDTEVEYVTVDVTEMESCDSALNGGCSHICTKDYDVTCSCPVGMYLADNGKLCQDLNECGYIECENSGRCVNTIGSYYCDCDYTRYRGELCEEKFTDITGTISVFDTDSAFDESGDLERISEWTCDLITSLLEEMYDWNFDTECSASFMRYNGESSSNDYYYDSYDYSYYPVDLIVEISERVDKYEVLPELVNKYFAEGFNFITFIVDVDIPGMNWCDTTYNNCDLRGCNASTSFNVECRCTAYQLWNGQDQECTAFEGLVTVPDLPEVTAQTGPGWYHFGCQTNPSDKDMLPHLSWTNANGEIVPTVDVTMADVSGMKVYAYSQFHPGLGHMKMLHISQPTEEDSGTYTCTLDVPDLGSLETTFTVTFKDCHGDSDYSLCGDAISCFSTNQKCDGVIDCKPLAFSIPDGEDEKGCNGFPTTRPPVGTCLNEQYRCPSDGYCIPMQWVCDSEADCDDETDEINCGGSITTTRSTMMPANSTMTTMRPETSTLPMGDCEIGKVECSSDRRCIPEGWVCDYTEDCSDGSDEAVCGECDGFECKESGNCISSDWVCDFFADCSDGSDEEGCGCPSYKTECPKITNGTFCIYPTDICDGYADCLNATEEYGCGSDCRGFLCDTTDRCIHRYESCDGVCDCGESCEDEMNCTCPEGDFMCDGICLFKSIEAVHCDGIPHCQDGTDEPADCKCMESQYSCYPDDSDVQQCLSNDNICDTVPDCEDGSDEAGCNCFKPYVECPGSESWCVSENFICDGDPDCPESLDEMNCGDDCSGYLCPSEDLCIYSNYKCDGDCDCGMCEDELEDCPCLVYNHVCDDGRCLKDKTVDVFCNGHRDCYDGSDERDGCSCSELQFDCLLKEANYTQCISKQNVCDGITDCDNGFDEDDCPCLKTEGMCLDGSCKPLSYFCDRFPDCADGSDEINCREECSNGTKNCPQYDGICIPEEEFCDDKDDCPQGTEEEGCPCTGMICESGQCAKSREVCNGVCDCESCEDDMNCVCPMDTFVCLDGMCTFQADYKVHCNGESECRDGSDELLNCMCLDSQFQCVDSEKCVPRSYRCDGIHQCNDSSDEIDCPCAFDQFKCDRLCQSLDRWCDGYEDCTDGSDEAMCDASSCHPEYQFDCQDTYERCVFRRDVCDGYSDCYSGQDEDEDLCTGLNTGCYRGSVPCPSDNNTCIEPELFCDGHRDCPLGEDEEHCTEGCMYPNMKCDNDLCVHYIKVCDGQVDCPNGEDEQDCTCVSPDLQCHNDLCVSEDNICDGVPDCPDGKDEHKCDCGKISEAVMSSPSAFISHGTDAMPGYHPWQAQIWHGEYFQGSGALINAEWIVTTASNIRSWHDPMLYKVVLGKTMLDGYDENAMEYTVTNFTIHPSFTYVGYGENIALMKINGRVETTDYVRPICLPQPGEQYHSDLVCRTAGWGRLADSTSPSEQLQEARMKIWSAEEKACSYLRPDESIGYPDETATHEDTICAGFESGKGPCLYDSGAPLVCLDQQNTYHLAGLSSSWEICLGFTYYTRVSQYVDWIQDAIHEDMAMTTAPTV